MADMIATNSTQLCPKFKMTDNPCSQMCWQGFPCRQSYPVWNNVSSGSTVCSDWTSVATPPCWSKSEGTVNSLDGKLLLHVEHCVIQSLAALANLWNHCLSDFQSFQSEAPPSNTPPLWRKWSERGHAASMHWNHQAEDIQCVCLAQRL